MARRKSAEPKMPSPRDPWVTRARRLGAKPTKDQRVRFIVDMMTRAEWITGRTGGEIATVWSLSPRIVENDASEATRFLRLIFDKDDKEDLKVRWLVELAHDTAQARKAGRYEAVRGLQELRAKGLGFLEPERHEHVIDGTIAGLAALAHDGPQDEGDNNGTAEPA